MNVIYNENLYMAQILEYSDAVKSELERVLPENDDEKKEHKKKLQQMYRIRNNAFCVLLRNGLVCERFDGLLILTINNKQYECKEDAIKTIFQKDYEKIAKSFIDKEESILEKSNEEERIETNVENETNKQTADSKDKKEEDSEKDKVKESEKSEIAKNNESNQKVETVPVPVPIVTTESESHQNLPNVEIIDNNKQKKDVKEDKKNKKGVEKLLNKNKKEEIKPQKVFEKEPEKPKDMPVYPKESEPSKTKDKIIMDIYTIRLKAPENPKKKAQEASENTMEIRVVPLEIPESGEMLSSSILVYVKTPTGEGVFASNNEGRKSVNVDTNMYDYLIRGEWKNGKFNSKIFPTGDTLAKKYEIDKKIERIRPENIEGVGLGHPVLFVTEPYEDDEITMKVHGIPLSDTNDFGDNAKSLFYLEKDESTSYISGEKGYIAYKFEDEVYKVHGSWKDDVYTVVNEHLY